MYNVIGCQMEFHWVNTSYVYTTEKWKQNFIHKVLDECWKYF